MNRLKYFFPSGKEGEEGDRACMLEKYFTKVLIEKFYIKKQRCFLMAVLCLLT